LSLGSCPARWGKSLHARCQHKAVSDLDTPIGIPQTLAGCVRTQHQTLFPLLGHA
jgi:hypothetical protein